MSEFCFSFSFNYCYYWSWVVGTANINFVLTMQRKILHSTRFPIVGGMGAWHPPPSFNFFRPPSPHQNQCPPWGTPPSPHLKMKPPHLKNNPPPPLKCEVPFHEMIPRKSTINNNLQSSQNTSKILVKKFIFNKFAGLQAYSQQLYYQMGSTTCNFQ